MRIKAEVNKKVVMDAAARRRPAIQEQPAISILPLLVVSVFAALVCYAVASRPPYIAATCMEFFITLGLLLLYLLKLNKMLTFIFWPLIDVFNSFFAAALMFILSLLAVSTYRLKGTLGGGIVGLVAVALWCLDGYLLLKKITFNKPGTKTTNPVEKI